MSIISEIHKDLEQGAVRLITEHRDRLMSEAVRLCGDMTSAEDLVSCTFAKAIRNIGSYKVDDNFFGWLKTIMVNIHRNNIRGPVARGTTPTDPLELEASSAVDWSSDERILQNSDNEALRAALERLDPKYKQVVSMHYFSELPVKSIATLLKLPVGTVLWRLNIARKILAKDLSEKLGKKKPLAVLLGALLLGGALFGAWQAGVAIVESMSESGRAVSMKPPTIEDNQTTLTAADPGEPVMTYPTFSSQATNKKEESAMTTLKKTVLAAFSAFSLMAADDAAAYPELKAYLVPDGASAMKDTASGFEYEYKQNGVKYGVAVFAKSGSWDVPSGVTSIDYLLVGGGGSGGGKYGGGGGAGGFLYKEGADISSVSALAVTVGAGGTQSGPWNSARRGGNSSLAGEGFDTVTAYGGGGGATQQGGVTQEDPITPSIDTDAAGLKGGATRAGGNGAGGNASGANGGAGESCAISGKADTYFAAGGGGNGGKGGSGIGGDGYISGDEPTLPGMDGTGSGGGGAIGGNVTGAVGGSGIVIIRYEIPAIISTVTVTTLGSGSVTGAGDYKEGATVTLVATAGEGSHFTSWEGAPAGATSVENTLTFTMGTEPVTITAKFDEDLAKGVTVASEGGNHGTPSPAYGTYAEYADGTERTYTMGGETVIPQGEGVKIYLAGWKLLTGTGELVRDSDTGLQDGESISLVKFTCGTSEAFTLVWRWETRYTLTTVANPAEGGTVTGAGDYAAGAIVTLTANVTGGYKLASWEGAPEDATSVENTLTFMMPAEATTVTANFETVPWGITVVSGETTEDHRDRCVPGTDYEFQSPLYYNVQEGASRKRCLGYTLTPMREGGEESEIKEAKLEGETLTATVTYFEPVKLTWKWADEYYFALTKDGEGTVTGPAEGWYASGTPFELTATPAKNYEFLCWMGSVTGTGATLAGTITAPTKVTAVFSPVQQVKSEWTDIEGLPAKTRTVKSLGKTYNVVVFTGSTTFAIPKNVTEIDYLLVGGGGGGASGGAGGGGSAGEFIYKKSQPVTAKETITVQVGSGVAGATGYCISAPQGGPLNNSTLEGAGIELVTAQAGVGGVGGEGPKLRPGGNGAGSQGSSNGIGGDGLPCAITGETVWYAAGGGGGSVNMNNRHAGGKGGGGVGGDMYDTDGINGEPNTGSGGGGGGKNMQAGGAGGSGVVIIRYAAQPVGMAIILY